SRTETFFRFVLDHLMDLARRALRHEVHTLSYYDETTGMLAVSDGGSGVWIRERGGHWQRTLHGENGTVFRAYPDADPGEPKFTSNPQSGELEQLDWLLKQFAVVAYHFDDVSPDDQ